MSLFHKIFGRGEAGAPQQTQQRFAQLKQKYQSVLNMADQQIKFQDLDLHDNKLFIRGVASSEDAKNHFWDGIKLVNLNADDITVDITVDSSRTMGTAVGGSGGQGGQTYTVKSGDDLSEISEQFYGDPNKYMRIFDANRDKLRDPDHLHVGQQLTIPPENS